MKYRIRPLMLAALVATLLPSTVRAAPINSINTAGTTVTSLPASRTIDAFIRTPDGRRRTYRVYIPSHLPSHPAPLLVALHGGTGWGVQFERNSGFDALAERDGFIVVYPDGVGAGVAETTMRTWNAGSCCGPAARKKVDDVGFIRQLIVTLERTYPVDRTRVFAAGHSNGGFMAYRLACELSDRIVAVGLQSGGLGVPTCRPAHPVSLLHIHGTADPNVPINGGVGSASISRVNYPSARWSVSTVADAMRATVGPKVVADPVNHDLRITTWAGSTSHTAVRLITVAGAGHTWMGHAPGNPRAPMPYMRLDSSDTIVRFLLAHSRR
jgi:polyhydroxybutyrate depolymerase